MATTRRDIELLISAKETTGRSFSQVTSNIDALNAKIVEQIAAAQKGEISLDDLRKTQEALAQAGRDLAGIQSQIDNYNKLAASTDKVAAAQQKAVADLAAFEAKLAAAGKTTDNQETKLQRLENAVTRTSAAYEKNKVDLTEQIAVLQRAGVAVESLDTSQTGIVNSARLVGAGLSQTKVAVADYAVTIAAARDAEASLAAQQGFERKIAEAQRLGQASRFVQLFGDAINTAKAADNQLSALTGFRAVGAQAAEASRDISQFVQAGQTMAVTSSQVAAGLRAIIDPGNAALQTLSGVEAAVEQASVAATENAKNVGALNEVYNQLAAATAAVLRQGSLVDQFQQQAVAAGAARQQFEAAQAEVQQYAAAMARADEPTEQLANALKLAEANLEKTGRALSQEETKLGQLSRELKTAGINTADLANEQRRLEAAAKSVSTATGQINQTLGRGGQRTNGLFGLKPNDLANLNFQLQDIFVSLQAGQNPLTVLFQQGSQISQIFPGLISSVAKLVLRFFPLIAVVVAVGAAFAELYTDSKRLEQAQKDLASLPTGGGLDPERFAQLQEKLEDAGHAAEDVRTAMLQLAEEGFDSDQIERYGQAAADLASRLGVDLTEATQLLVDVQQGGIESVYELAERTNDLTEADLNHAEALYEAGRAGEARQFVLDRIAERNAQIAEASESAWTPAVNNLKSAWSSFSDFLGRVLSPVIDAINQQIAGLIAGVTFLTALLAGKGFSGAADDALLAANRYLGVGADPNKSAAKGRGATDQSIRDRRFNAELDGELENSRELTNQERLRRAETEARARAQAAGVSSAVEERAVQQAIGAEQRKINEEAARNGRRSSAAANRAARAAAAEERRQAQALRQLDGQLRQLNRAAFSGGSASLEERLTAISERYETVADSIKRVRDLGLTTDSGGTPLADIERQVAATQQRLQAEETIKFYQEQAGLLEQQRADEVERILDAQARNAISVNEAMAQAEEVSGRLSPQIVQAAERALAVARALAGTNPSPEMVSWIAQLERIISAEGTNRTVADVGMAGLDRTSAELDDLLKQRDELVKGYELLNDLGLRTAAQTREATTAAFAAQGEAIQPVLDRLRATVEALHGQIDPLSGLPVLTDTAYNTWLVKLDAVNAGLQQSNVRLSELENIALQGVANGGVEAFNTLSSSLAGFIAGTQSLGSVFSAVGVTILQTLQQITAAIAAAIIKFLILRALETAAGLPPGTLSGGGGGGAAGGIGGLFKLFHDGGKVGSRGASTQRRSGASAAQWIGAPKLHGGGMAGLGADEYRAILKRNEEVLTEDNPRHVDNFGRGGGGGGQPPSVKQVLLLDPEAVPAAMQSRSGEKAILTIIRQNKATLKQVLS